MKKIFVSVAIVLGLAIATAISVSASMASCDAVMAADSSVVCTGPKSGGECECVNARPCRDNTGCQPKGFFERLLEMF